MSSLTDRPTEDPHSSEHLIALQLLQEQMEGLKKTLQQKEQQLLEKEKKVGFCKFVLLQKKTIYRGC